MEKVQGHYVSTLPAWTTEPHWSLYQERRRTEDKRVWHLMFCKGEYRHTARETSTVLSLTLCLAFLLFLFHVFSSAFKVF